MTIKESCCEVYFGGKKVSLSNISVMAKIQPLATHEQNIKRIKFDKTYKTKFEKGYS